MCTTLCVRSTLHVSNVQCAAARKFWSGVCGCVCVYETGPQMDPCSCMFYGVCVCVFGSGKIRSTIRAEANDRARLTNRRRRRLLVVNAWCAHSTYTRQSISIHIPEHSFQTKIRCFFIITSTFLFFFGLSHFGSIHEYNYYRRLSSYVHWTYINRHKCRCYCKAPEKSRS